jgi:RNA polymerase sigma factor (sigma-70 family)
MLCEERDGILPREADARLERLARRLCRSCAPAVSPELENDCLQEARVTLWNARRRLRSLPAGERQAYAAACVRRAVRRCLAGELRSRLHAVSLDDVAAAHQPSVAAAEVPDIESIEGWLCEFRRAELVERITGLAAKDRAILHLYYAHGLTDREIAGRLGFSAGAVAQQRSRLIRSLRRSFATADEKNPDSMSGFGPARA